MVHIKEFVILQHNLLLSPEKNSICETNYDFSAKLQTLLLCEIKMWYDKICNIMRKCVYFPPKLLFVLFQIIQKKDINTKA